MSVNTFDTSISFNSIIILESLSDSELTLVDELEDFLRSVTVEFSIGLYRFKVRSKREIINELIKVSHSIEFGLLPIMHIAMHGSTNGLSLLDDSISWEELEPHFSDINLKTKNNLLITFAVCFGAHSIDFYKLNRERAPFFGIIAPKGIINASIVDEAMLNFYKAYFDLKHATKAYTRSIDRLANIDKSNITIIDSTSFIVNALLLYLDSIKKGLKRHDLIRAYEERFDHKMPYELKSKIQYREELLEAIKPTLISILHRYLMVDVLPSNYERLKVSELEQYIFQ